MNTERDCPQVGFVVEVLVGSWSRNAEVWPDASSADAAGRNLLARWFVPTDFRVTEVLEVPNRPTWDQWVATRGLPPTSVQL